MICISTFAYTYMYILCCTYMSLYVYHIISEFVMDLFIRFVCILTCAYHICSISVCILLAPHEAFLAHVCFTGRLTCPLAGGEEVDVKCSDDNFLEEVIQLHILFNVMLASLQSALQWRSSHFLCLISLLIVSINNDCVWESLWISY